MILFFLRINTGTSGRRQTATDSSELSGCRRQQAMLQLVSAFYYSTNVLNYDMAGKILIFGASFSAGYETLNVVFCDFLGVRLVGKRGG
jgi:hypothetical protein